MIEKIKALRMLRQKMQRLDKAQEELLVLALGITEEGKEDGFTFDFLFNGFGSPVELLLRLQGTTPVEQEKCVHTRHCCADHGCKYGKPDCPVEMGQKSQEYPCEDCHVIND